MALTLGLLFTACFDPSDVGGTEVDDTETAGDSGTAAPDDDGDDDGTGPTGGPAGSGSGDPTGDPSGDPTGDPNDPTGGPTDPTGGPSDPTDTTTGDDDATGDTGSSPACGADEACIPEAPAGWSGPGAVYRGSDPAPPCPASMPAMGFAAQADLDAPAAQCDCECGAAEGFSCSTTVHENYNSCLLFPLDPQEWTLANGQCTDISSSSANFGASTASLVTAGASCDPAHNEVVQPASWGTHVQACEIPDAGVACDGGLCGPAAADPYGSVCIWVEGDATCPDGDYSAREVVYTDLADDRGCSDCSCGAPTGTCGGSVTFTSGCSGLVVLYGEVDAGSCGNIGSQHDSITYHAQPDVTCAPQGGDAVGQAQGTGPITLCCLP